MAKRTPPRKRRGRKRPADRCSKSSHAKDCRPGRPLCRWMRAQTKKHRPCLCPAYHFPHRPGSGYCGHPERLHEEELAWREDQRDAETSRKQNRRREAGLPEPEDDCPFEVDDLVTAGSPPSNEPF